MQCECRKLSDRGAAAVELALVLPVLLMIVFGVIDYGRMLNAQITLTEAAREGARAAAVGQNESQVRTRVLAAASTMTPQPTVTTQVCVTGGGTDARVTATYTFSYVTPFAAIGRMFGGGPGGTVVLTSTGEMTCAF